jgi:hypothetical protein
VDVGGGVADAGSTFTRASAIRASEPTPRKGMGVRRFIDGCQWRNEGGRDIDAQAVEPVATIRGFA